MSEPEQTSTEIAQALRDEIAQQREAAEAEPDPAVRERRLHHAAIRSEVVEEEAAAISEEITENKETALSLRIPQSLSQALKQRANAEGLPVSALVRRLLSQAMHQPTAPAPTIEQVEQIARRAAREEFQQLRDTA